MSRLNLQGRLNVQGNIHHGASGPPTLPNSGAVVAYSLRKLFNSYNGFAISVQRSGDLLTQNIGFTNYNVLDVASLSAFCGSQEGRVVTWYDQSGNGYNLGSGNSFYGVTTPLIYDGVNISKTINNIPAINFGGISALVSSNALPDITFESFFAVEQHPAADDDTNQRLYSKRQNDFFVSHIVPEFVTYYNYKRGSAGYLQVNSTQVGGISDTINIIEVTAATTATADLRLNGTNIVASSTPGPAFDNNGFALCLGANLVNTPAPAAGNFFTGYISEFIAYNSNQAAFRKQIFDNINYYYVAV